MKDLSLREASFLLLTPSVNQSSYNLSSIRSIVLGKNYTWVSSDDIQLVVLRLFALHHRPTHPMGGEALARLVARLVEVEVKPGGPYLSTERKHLLFNGLVAQLFRQHGSPIEALESYLANTALAHLTYIAESPLRSWSLYWPTRIVGTQPSLNIPKPQSTEARFVHELFNSRSNRLESKVIVGERSSEASRQAYSHLARAGLMRKTNRELWAKVSQNDRVAHISDLSQIFNHSLRKPYQTKDEVLINSLGLANFYAWMAYTIYDNIIDDESESIVQLPLANVCHRLSFSEYKKYMDIKTLMGHYNRVDLANHYELSYARAEIQGDIINLKKIPKYKSGRVLADRASGHVIGPLILCSLQPKITPNQIDLISRGLDHYLIARQINDDAHDWRFDLKQGRISYAVALILERSDIQPGRYSMQTLMRLLSSTFQKSGGRLLCELALQHTDKAKSALIRSGLLSPDEQFTKTLISPIEEVATSALKELQEISTFSEVYKSVIDSD